MPSQIFEKVSADLIDGLTQRLKQGGASRIKQTKNPDGTFRVAAYSDEGIEYDLFISYASEDLDLCVEDFIKALWRHGVISIWFDRLSIDVREPIPKKVNEGLLRSKYVMCVVTETYFRKYWPRIEFSSVEMQQKEIIPIWVDTNFQAVNNFAPTLACRKAIIYDGDADFAMSVVARILLEDETTNYFAAKSSRLEKEVFWGMVWMYIKFTFGILDASHARKLTKIFPGSSWKKHIESELGINKQTILTLAAAHSNLSNEDKAFLVLAILKRRSDGWFPTYDEELRVLRAQGVSDW
jgi:TIR domain